jgi:hypothetical protein
MKSLLVISSAFMVIMLIGSLFSIALFQSAFAQSSAVTVTITTNKKLYALGESITVKGKVSKIQSSYLVGLSIIAPNGNVQFLKGVKPDLSGAFSTVISNYQTPQEGTHRIVATYGSAKTEVKIQITSGQATTSGQANPPVKKHTDLCDLSKMVCIGVQKLHSPDEKKACGVSSMQECTGSKWNGKFYHGDKIQVNLTFSAKLDKVKIQIIGPNNYKHEDKTLYRFQDYCPPSGCYSSQSSGFVGSSTWDHTYTFSANVAPLGAYTFRVSASYPGVTSDKLTDAVGIELIKKPSAGPPVNVFIFGKGFTVVKLHNFDSGKALSKLVIHGSWTPPVAVNVEKGWTTSMQGNAIVFETKTKAIGNGQNAQFTLKLPLDSINWTAYDTSGKIIGSGTAKKS